MKNSMLGVLVAVASMSAAAFDEDGFRTGMSVNDVATAVQREGWTLARSGLTAGAFMEVHYDQNGKVAELGPANFTFCNGALIAYVRALDFDTEYASTLRDLIYRYGNQPQVRVDQNTWSGPGGGYVTTVRTTWKVGRERADISFQPEEHTGNGSLKHYRGASLAYVLPGACSEK